MTSDEADLQSAFHVALEAAFTSGVTDAEIAHAIGVSLPTLHRWRARNFPHGLTLPWCTEVLVNLKLLGEFRLALRTAIASGLTEKEIARMTGASRVTVSRWVTGENAPHPALQAPLIKDFNHESAKRAGKS